LIHNGYGVFDCGSEGWSSTLDEFGVSKRTTSWSHAMKVAAVDDRTVIKQKYGEPLVLSNNNWGNCYRGGRDIFGTESLVASLSQALRKYWEQIGIVNPSTGRLMIPLGACWIRWSEFRRRYMVALSGAEGWKPNAKNDSWVTA
jgi:hypothetical protein